jgi:hypothetical protein
MARLYVLIGLAVLIAGCSTQNSANSSIAKFGDCTVDLRQICETFYRQPTFTLNGAETNAREVQENAPRHTQIWLPFTYPNGDLIANLECMMDTEKKTASYARLLSGPPITEKEVQYARSLGLCADQSGNMPAAIKQIEKNITPGGT